MATLHEIVGDLRALDEILREVDGDITDPRAGQTVDQWLAQLHQDLETKVEGYCEFISAIQNRLAPRSARYQLVQEEAQRLKDLVASDERLILWLKSKLQSGLETLGIRRLETATHRVSIINQGGVPPVIILDETQVPDTYKTYLPQINKEALRKDLERGMTVPGAELGPRGTRLKIR